MNRIIFLTLFALVLNSNWLYSQKKYRVEYDYLSNQTSYLLLDKNDHVIDTMTKPIFKKNRAIQVRLKNVNPFALKVVPEFQGEKIHDVSGPKLRSTGGTGGVFDFSSLMGNLQGLLNKLKNSSSSGTGSTSSRGEIQQSNDLDNLYDKTITIEVASQKVNVRIKDPNITKDSLILEFNSLRKNLGQADPDLVRSGAEDMYVFLNNLRHSIMNSVSNISYRIEEMKESSLNEINQGNASRGMEFKKSYDTLTFSKTREELEQLSQTALKQVDILRSIYSNLEMESFEQTYDVQVDADIASLNFKFLDHKLYDNDENEQKLVREKNIKVFLKGGVKINTGVGLSFISFGKKSKEYFVDNNGIINEEINKSFKPSTSALINFYPVLSENFNFGGIFGLAIPVSGMGSGVNYIFGPSLYFGNKNMLSISAGIALGTVDSLGNGYNVGDPFKAGNLGQFIKKRYDTGYFIGLTFNFMDLN
ncbi:MAG: hypothetical protein WBJ84_05905 [Bacteroidales bacterium]